MTGPVGAARAYEAGLELLAAGRYFEAHEELETAWRSAQSPERDFFQGLVHVAVAWYQLGRANRVGCERQLEKADRRLSSFAPCHRELDVSDLLRQVAEARVRYPDLAPVTITRCRGSRAHG